MNDFLFYSMGDGEFIEVVLIGMAHMFDSGQMAVLMKIGILLGLLLALGASVIAPDKSNLPKFALTMVVLGFMFSKTVPINVISKGGAEVQTIPGVPIGIATVAHFTTGMGYSLANLARSKYVNNFNVDYNGPMMENDIGRVSGNGLEPLRTLLEHRFDGNVLDFEIYQNNTALNINDSIENYMSECVYRDIYNGNTAGIMEVNIEKAMTNQDAWTDLKVGYEGWFVDIYLTPNRELRRVSCKEAYYEISTAFNSIATNDPIDDEIGLSMDALQQPSRTAHDLKVNAVLKYHYLQSANTSEYASEADVLASEMEFEAIDKRRIASAQQYSLWAEMALPLITFLEAFVFMLAPLMPFIIAVSEKGLAMAGKYFFVLIWVNTWPFMQVFVNLYLQFYINKMGITQAKSYDAFSWVGYNTSFTEIESFVTMGSNLQTMIPPLSLMILYGSVHSMINLSTKAAAANSSAESSVASPQVIAPTNLGNQGYANVQQTSTGSGYVSTNSTVGVSAAPLGISQINASAATNNSQGSSVVAAETQMRADSQQIAHSRGQMYSNVLNAMRGETAVSGEGSSLGGTEQQVARTAKTLQEKYNISNEDATTAAMALTGKLGAKANAAFAARLGIPDNSNNSGVSAGIAIAGDASVEGKVAKAIKALESASTGVGLDKDTSTSTAEDKAWKETLTKGLSKSTSETIADSNNTNKLTSANESYNQSSSLVKAAQEASARVDAMNISSTANMAQVGADGGQNIAPQSALSGHTGFDAFRGKLFEQDGNNITHDNGLNGAEERAQAYAAYGFSPSETAQLEANKVASYSESAKQAALENLSKEQRSDFAKLTSGVDPKTGEKITPLSTQEAFKQIGAGGEYQSQLQAHSHQATSDRENLNNFVNTADGQKFSRLNDFMQKSQPDWAADFKQSGIPNAADPKNQKQLNKAATLYYDNVLKDLSTVAQGDINTGAAAMRLSGDFLESIGSGIGTDNNLSLVGRDINRAADVYQDVITNKPKSDIDDLGINKKALQQEHEKNAGSVTKISDEKLAKIDALTGTDAKALFDNTVLKNKEAPEGHTNLMNNAERLQDGKNAAQLNAISDNMNLQPILESGAWAADVVSSILGKDNLDAVTSLNESNSIDPRTVNGFITQDGQQGSRVNLDSVLNGTADSSTLKTTAEQLAVSDRVIERADSIINSPKSTPRDIEAATVTKMLATDLQEGVKAGLNSENRDTRAQAKLVTELGDTISQKQADGSYNSHGFGHFLDSLYSPEQAANPIKENGGDVRSQNLERQSSSAQARFDARDAGMQRAELNLEAAGFAQSFINNSSSATFKQAGQMGLSAVQGQSTTTEALTHSAQKAFDDKNSVASGGAEARGEFVKGAIEIAKGNSDPFGDIKRDGAGDRSGYIAQRSGLLAMSQELSDAGYTRQSDNISNYVQQKDLEGGLKLSGSDPAAVPTQTQQTPLDIPLSGTTGSNEIMQSLPVDVQNVAQNEQSDPFGDVSMDGQGRDDYIQNRDEMLETAQRLEMAGHTEMANNMTNYINQKDAQLS